MDEREFENGLIKMLGTSWEEYIATPISTQYTKFQDAEYRLQKASKLVDSLHLGLVIALPIGMYLEFNRLAQSPPFKATQTIEQKVIAPIHSSSKSE